MLFQIVIAAFAAVISLVYMIFSSVGPGVFLAVASPFDGLFWGLFGIFGNGVTFLPLLAFLITTPPSFWLVSFFGTRIQQFTFLFILVLSISHMITLSIYPEAAVLEYLRKLTLFMVLGIWAWYMRTPQQLLTLNRALVVSTTAFTLISMADFYFGIGALPGAQESFGGVAGETLEDVYSAHSLRYRGAGLPINRTANWLLVPSFLAFGWFMLSSRGRAKTIALVCTIVCVTGIFATVGRSAILAIFVGFVVLLPRVAGLRPDRILGGAVAVTAIATVGLLLMAQLGFLEVLEARFFGEESEGAFIGRLDVYEAAIRIWMTSPVIGVGDAAMKAHPLYIGMTAHNSFLGLLAEAGLVGFIPYLALTILFTRRFLRRQTFVDPEFDAWRPYFLAGFVASMTQNMFNEYTWERFIWYSIAYLIAHERLDSAGRTAAVRKSIEDSQRAVGPISSTPAGASVF